MQLDQKEEQLIHACRKEESSWKPWARAFSITGYTLIVIWWIARRMLNAGAPLTGEAVLMLVASAFYLIDAGVNERREHSLRKLVLKFAEDK